MSISVSVSQSGDFGATTDARTVTIPTSGNYTLTVSTSDDSADEADGSVTATVNTGSGYTVSSGNGAATVAVADDDDPLPATPEISISAGSGITEGSDGQLHHHRQPDATGGAVVGQRKRVAERRLWRNHWRSDGNHPDRRELHLDPLHQLTTMQTNPTAQ